MNQDTNTEKLTADFRTEMINWFFRHRDILPEECIAPVEERLQTITDILNFLMETFRIIENYIDKCDKASVIPGLEKDAKKYAHGIMILLLAKYGDLKENEQYRKLLGQRHIAYSFFKTAGGGIFEEKEILEDPVQYKILYLGLLDFYDKYFGTFKDNEEAIQLICEFYPQNIDMEFLEEGVANVLIGHIANAGTVSDLGYAFHGIQQIRTYIGYLPVSVIQRLLQYYHLFEVINKPVHRHQIYTIIHYSKMEQEEKKITKFWYLESLMLADKLDRYLYEMLYEENKYIVPYFTDIEEDLSTDKLKVLLTPETYWKNEEICKKRSLFYKGDVLVFIEYTGENIIVRNQNGKKIVMPFVYEDWRLAVYREKDNEEKIRNIIWGCDRKLSYNHMVFSLLHLDQYRGVTEQTIDFDHTFSYDFKNRKLRKLPQQEERIPHFYGKYVYSLSCIVGRNGMGKTSMVDFLRETFFKMLKLIEAGMISCYNGYIQEEDYSSYRILDSDARFLVVFKMGDRSFFLTNMEKVAINGAAPFDSSVYTSVNEFSKIAYFSNMLKTNQDDLFGDYTERKNGNREGDISRILKEFRQADYSETESFLQKHRAIEYMQRLWGRGYVTGDSRPTESDGTMGNREKIEEETSLMGEVLNREILYQLTFLKNTSSKKMQEYLDLDENKIFEFETNWLSDKDQFGWDTIEHQPDKIEGYIRKYISVADARLQHFSSGQYAKFTFLARLYWFLEGGQREQESHKGSRKQNEFYIEETLQEDETALIFIDEGELYYHPEWQRRYVKTLLEMIHQKTTKSRVQVVITTNSPFILSDVLKEDVIYLSKDKEKNFDNTLGQNIHKLLRDNFFMDFTIGEYTKEMMERIMKGLQDPDTDIQEQIEWYCGTTEDVYASLKLLIQQIGEPVYRYSLEKLLKHSSKLESEKQLEQLLEEKRELEEKIEKLQKKEQN